MATSATPGYGCLLKKGTVTVAEVRSIGGPSMTREMVDVSSMDSTSAMEYISAGLFDGGEVSVTGNWIPSNTTQTCLHNDLTATAQTYALLFSDSSTTTWTVSLLVSAFSPNMPVGDAMTFDATLKVTGTPTFA